MILSLREQLELSLLGEEVFSRYPDDNGMQVSINLKLLNNLQDEYSLPLIIKEAEQIAQDDKVDIIPSGLMWMAKLDTYYGSGILRQRLLDEIKENTFIDLSTEPALFVDFLEYCFFILKKSSYENFDLNNMLSNEQLLAKREIFDQNLKIMSLTFLSNSKTKFFLQEDTFETFIAFLVNTSKTSPLSAISIINACSDEFKEAIYSSDLSSIIDSRALDCFLESKVLYLIKKAACYKDEPISEDIENIINTLSDISSLSLNFNEDFNKIFDLHNLGPDLSFFDIHKTKPLNNLLIILSKIKSALPVNFKDFIIKPKLLHIMLDDHLTDCDSLIYFLDDYNDEQKNSIVQKIIGDVIYSMGYDLENFPKTLDFCKKILTSHALSSSLKSSLHMDTSIEDLIFFVNGSSGQIHSNITSLASSDMYQFFFDHLDTNHEVFGVLFLLECTYDLERRTGLDAKSQFSLPPKKDECRDLSINDKYAKILSSYADAFAQSKNLKDSLLEIRVEKSYYKNRNKI